VAREGCARHAESHAHAAWRVSWRMLPTQAKARQAAVVAQYAPPVVTCMGSTPRVRKNIELLSSSWWNTQQPGAKYLLQRHATCAMRHAPCTIHLSYRMRRRSSGPGSTATDAPSAHNADPGVARCVTYVRPQAMARAARLVPLSAQLWRGSDRRSRDITMISSMRGVIVLQSKALPPDPNVLCRVPFFASSVPSPIGLAAETIARRGRSSAGAHGRAPTCRCAHAPHAAAGSSAASLPPAQPDLNSAQ
jgi:hypothetical protein